MKAALPALTGRFGGKVSSYFSLLDQRRPVARQRISSVRLMFLVGVGVPTIVAALYFGLFASSRYVSEAQFVVRGVSHRKSTGLDALLQTFGISRAADDANLVQSYMLSRDALRAMTEQLPIRDLFGPARADVFSRFPRPWSSDSFERLYDYYLSRVSVIQSATKGITTLEVQAFDPHESQAIASTLLTLAEDMVNRMNDRIQSDSVHYSELEASDARQKLLESQRALTDFRTREMLIDPASSSMSVLDTITSLSTDLSDAKAQAAEASSLTVTSPALPSLKARIDSLTSSIKSERAKIAGDGDALAPRVATYEQLALARKLAERSLAQAETSLETARQEARRQQLYIERVVSPQVPDEGTEPERLRMIATVFVMCFAMTSVVWLLSAGVKEHMIE